MDVCKITHKTSKNTQSMLQKAKVLLKWSSFWDTKNIYKFKILQSHNNFNFQRIVLYIVKTISKGCMFYATHDINLDMTNI